jgi:hypothetical protein
MIVDYSAHLARVPAGLQHTEEVERALRETEGWHGFWLVNNVAVIAEKIDDRIHHVGYRQTYSLLTEIKSVFVVGLYKAIELERDKAYKAYKDTKE